MISTIVIIPYYFSNRSESVENFTLKPEIESELDSKIIQEWKISGTMTTYFDLRKSVIEKEYIKETVNLYYYDGFMIFLGFLIVISLIVNLLVGTLILLEKIGITGYFEAKRIYYCEKLTSERKTLKDLMELQRKIAER